MLRVIDTPESSRKISDKEIVWLDELKAQNLVESRFNSIFFFTGASREPELAGIWGAVVGSFLTMIVTLAIAFPIGVSAAIYLEEFAPKNRWTNLIEVNINNLAAVPSIVFGLLGLAVFLNLFGLPRSAPVVGGMVLALMTLPIIIIASRASLRAVPPSIREAALGIGASKVQTVFHHVLPLAMPGIMTGTILGMAHALGETAPLLMIGMVAFIVDIPGGFTDPATILPVQIFMWADFPEAGFQQKTSAAILILLAFLIIMNADCGDPAQTLRAALVSGVEDMNIMTEAAVEQKIMPGRTSRSIKMKGDKVTVHYGEKRALFDVDLDIREKQVTALIGPSGCGKSTFLRCLNRMNDTISIAKVTGKITLDGEDIYDPAIDVVELRARVGMVFQKPNPFPKSIYDNVAYGPRIHGLTKSKADLDEVVESSLKKAALWNEVKDRLHESGTGLSGGQQQRLCIARAIAVSPEVILMDEPCSALDPIATAKVEELIDELRSNYTIVIVTHSMQQAARVSQRTAMFHLGYLVEEGRDRQDVHQPRRQAHPGLHHRPFRLSGFLSAQRNEDLDMGEHTVTSFDEDLEHIDRLIRDMGDLAGAMVGASIRALLALGQCAGAARHFGRRHHGRQAARAGRPRHHADRQAPADGAGSARRGRRDPHGRRSRAHRRSRQEHRQARRRGRAERRRRATCRTASKRWPSWCWGRSAAWSSNMWRAMPTRFATCASTTRRSTCKYTAVFRELLTYMMEDPRNITACTHLLFCAKNLERIGDHVTNIAENAYYVVTGEQLPANRPKLDETALAVLAE